MPGGKKNDTERMKLIAPNTTAFSVAIIAIALNFVASSASALSDRRIEDARYACISFINSLDERSSDRSRVRAELAQFWVMGFLAGAYDASAVLEFSDDSHLAENAVIGRVKDYCEENRENSFHAAAVGAGSSPEPLPAATSIGLDPRTYSCGAYSDGLASRGDAKELSEAAEFWAFAFVQGTVSVRHHPRLVIAVANKRKIVRALKQSCARNPTRTLLDQTSEIAMRVRPLPE